MTAREQPGSETSVIADDQSGDAVSVAHDRRIERAYMAAVHEAGHAVVAYLKNIPLVEVSILLGGNYKGVTDTVRLHDIEQKLRCWAYLSHHPDTERDVA